MLYTFFLKKNKGDKKPFSIAELINLYSKTFSQDVVISFPGFMSKSISKIADFKKLLPLTDSVYFTVGMNGNTKLNGTNYTIQEEYNKQYSSKMNFPNFKTDHSKILFFIDEKHCDFDNQDIQVKAVLIGSTNQSYESYFKSPAKKGEADIFIVDGESIDNDDTKAESILVKIYEGLSKNLREQIVFGKQLCGNNPNYLNNLLLSLI